MRSRAAPRSPTRESVELIRRCAREISPDEGLEGWYRSYAAGQTGRLALDVDIVKRFVEPGSAIVEVGALPLLLTLALATEGFEVVGVDIDPSRFSAAISEHGLQVERCDIETEPLPFASASADALLFNELLEHLRINPVFALEEAHRVLRPGGLLLLSTPNLRSLNGLWNLLVHSRSYALKGDIYEEYQNLATVGHMGHVREYAPGDVRQLLARIGFAPEALLFRGRQPHAAAELLCRLRPGLRRFVTYAARAV